MRDILIGLLFASLWASASVATKIGLLAGEPLVITNIRFVLAAALMLVWAHGVLREKWPPQNELLPLAIYGALNCAIYLGAFALAMREVTAGIGTLAVGLSPLMISILSAVFLKKRIGANVWGGLALGLLGVGVATYPNLVSSTATPRGIAIMATSMLSYAIGTVYYANRTWTSPRLVINGWQIFFGALLLLPLTLLLSHPEKNHNDPRFWGAIFWLAIPVSIGAVQLWLYLLKKDAVSASLWLFLCPVLGFLYAWVVLGEPISHFTVIGTVLVIAGLYVGKLKTGS
jgi:probable blue pigment (indigoidine) exporter